MISGPVVILCRTTFHCNYVSKALGGMLLLNFLLIHVLVLGFISMNMLWFKWVHVTTVGWSNQDICPAISLNLDPVASLVKSVVLMNTVFKTTGMPWRNKTLDEITFSVFTFRKEWSGHFWTRALRKKTRCSVNHLLVTEDRASD